MPLSSREFDFSSEQHNPYRYFPVDDEGLYSPPMDQPTLDRCAQSLRIMQLVASASMLGSSALLLITILTNGQATRLKAKSTSDFYWTLVVALVGIASFLVVRSLKPKQWKETFGASHPIDTSMESQLRDIETQLEVSFAFLAIPSVVACFQYFRTGNLLCLSTCLILIGVMAISFPRWSWLEAKMERRSWKTPTQ